MSDEFFSLREAAARVGRAPGTLRRYIKSGRIQAQKRRGKFGMEYLIRPEDLEQLQLDQSLLPARVQEAPPLPAELGDLLAKFVPVTVYNELATKHERLLIEFGMLRAGTKEIPERSESETNRILEQKDREVRSIRMQASEEEEFLRKHLRESEEELRERDHQFAILQEKLHRLESRFLETPGAETSETAAGPGTPQIEAEPAFPAVPGSRHGALTRLQRWLEVCQKEMNTEGGR